MKLTTEELRDIIIEELESVIDEKKGSKRQRKKKAKKDACYRKVKARYDVWPSAYGSGALSKCRKVGAKNWGNKSKKEESLRESDEFKPHMMYDPKTGKSEMTNKVEDHERLAKQGYTHVDPEVLRKVLKDEGGASGMDPFLKAIGDGMEDEIKKTLDAMPDVGQHKDKDYILDDDKEIDVVKEQKKNCGCGQDPCKTYGNVNESLLKDPKVSKHLKYHIREGVGVDKNVFRPDSDSFYSLFEEVRKLHSEGRYTLNENEKHYILETDIGKFGMFEGERVALDHPMLNEDDIEEAKQKKKKDPPIGKPTKNTGSGKKYKVYVRNPKTGNIKKITYGDAKGGLKGNWNNAEARKSFAARHNCADKKDRTKSGYWACRAHKDFGKNVPGRFW